MTTNAPVAILDKITVRKGIAGQVSVSAEMHYSDDDNTYEATFVGSVYGGPVLALFGHGNQTWVTEPNRFGDALNADWVKRFYARTNDNAALSYL